MEIVAAPTSGSALQHVLDRVEESGRPPHAVPDPIHRSWERCAGAGIDPDHVAVPFEPDVEADSRLSWAAGPAMTAVSEALADEPVALLLADQRGHVVQRAVGSTKAADIMDGIGAAPGFLCREELVGTNSIGLALLTSSLNVVLGFEHYADNLTVVSCASAPVVHPATGQHLGVVNITSKAGAFHAALPALLDRVLAETRARLSEDHGVPSAALRAAFLSARRKTKGPLIAVSSNTMFFNTAAGATLSSHLDRAAVWSLGGATDSRPSRSSRDGAPPLSGPTPGSSRTRVRRRVARRRPRVDRPSAHARAERADRWVTRLLTAGPRSPKPSATSRNRWPGGSPTERPLRFCSSRRTRWTTT